ncbi:protein kinase, partial [Arthrobacter sp. 2YAF22_2]|uniref:PASTA domain-containing protein n=1 Tax=Arthrobacter sp. 2YAF22_2 TaxID=3233029 RepID=UPI003F925A9F
SQSPTPSATSSSATPTQSTPAAINLIPDAYKGRPFNDVRTELIGMGLQVKGAPVFDPAAPNTVLDINPSGPVQRGDVITVSYSKGPDMRTVPTLEQGATEAAVQQAIQGAGLRWQKGDPVAGRKNQLDGTFVSSEPTSGQQVPAGSVVIYHLAAAPAPTSSSPATPSSSPGQ